MTEGFKNFRQQLKPTDRFAGIFSILAGLPDNPVKWEHDLLPFLYTIKTVLSPRPTYFTTTQSFNNGCFVDMWFPNSVPSCFWSHTRWNCVHQGLKIIKNLMEIVGLIFIHSKIRMNPNFTRQKNANLKRNKRCWNFLTEASGKRSFETLSVE